MDVRSPSDVKNQIVAPASIFRRLDRSSNAAAVSRVAGEPLQIEEVVVAPPQALEVRIKIICTTLCHTDLTFWRAHGVPGVYPIVLGHEAVGVVESVGDGVAELAVGDTVLPVCIAQCGDCPDCLSDRSNMCSRLPFRSVSGMPRDDTSRFADAAGARLNHFCNVSSFSEYTVVDIAHIVKINLAAIPPKLACLLGCGISTGVGATWRAAPVERGSTVAVFGLGAVGLAVAEGARLRGAAMIIGVDMKSEKFETGKEFGVTDFINPKEIGDRSISEVIKEMTGGGGADCCFECVGSASLMAAAFESSREGWGKTVVLGLDMEGSPISISPIEILRGRSISGCCLGGIKPKNDIPVLIDHYVNKELHLDGFITQEIGFSEINKAFELMIQGKSLRCIIWMDK